MTLTDDELDLLRLMAGWQIGWCITYGKESISHMRQSMWGSSRGFHCDTKGIHDRRHDTILSWLRFTKWCEQLPESIREEGRAIQRAHRESGFANHPDHHREWEAFVRQTLTPTGQQLDLFEVA